MFFDILEEVIENKRKQQIGSCLIENQDYKNKETRVILLPDS